MPNVQPRVFLGSSRESLPVLTVIAKAIGDICTVVPWTDQQKFKRPGTFLLDSLIAAANQFDIAVLVLGHDDVVVSRKKEMRAPRDNVIFELGLFMSVLDRSRTIIVSPKSSKLKILSDLDGLNLTEYNPPRRRSGLKAALKPAIGYIREQIHDLHIKVQRYAPKGVATVWKDIEKFLAVRGAVPHKFENIALDMELTWGWLREEVLEDPDRHNMSLRILFIDHRSKRLAKLKSESVSLEVARAREREMRAYFAGDVSHLRRRNVNITIAAYDEVPIVHGFLVNDKQLFISVCGIKDGRLLGSPNPYLVFEKPTVREKDRAGHHFCQVFRGWFDHYWQNARVVCSSHKLPAKMKRART